MKTKKKQQFKEPGALRKYPWELWLGSKRPITLIKGRDFRCSVRIMAQQAVNRAHLMGWRISYRIDGKLLKIQNVSKNGKPKV